MRGLSPVAVSGGRSSSRCTGLSLSRPLFLRSTDSRRAVSVVVAHGLSCSAACGILPDQGSNPCALHWQADSKPLRHQGSPMILLMFIFFNEGFYFEMIIDSHSVKIIQRNPVTIYVVFSKGNILKNCSIISKPKY